MEDEIVNLLDQALVVDLEWSPPHQGDKLLAVGWGDYRNGDYCHLPGIVPRGVWEDIATRPFVSFTEQDAVQLLRRGYKLKGPLINLQVIPWLLNENQKLRLEDVAKKYTKLLMDKRIVRRGDDVLFRCDNGEVVPIEEAPKNQLRAYCKRDVVAERRLLALLLRKLAERGWLDYFLIEEVPYTRTLVDMELAGMPIDLVASEALRSELEAEHAKLARQLTAGLPPAFNLNSDTQVSDYLFRKTVFLPGRVRVGERIPNGFEVDSERNPGRLWVWGTWVFKGRNRKRGQLTDACKEEKCQHEDPDEHRGAVNKTALRMNPATQRDPWVVKYLDYQKIDTLLTSFLRKFPVIARPDANGNPRIHSRFVQTGTRTGRLSSRNPNMQNVPTRGDWGKKIRALFRTPNEDLPFLMGDYSQLETRLMAHFSQDPYLLKIFREGRDPFIEMASDIHGRPIGKEDDERAATKNLWYAQGYGAMPPKMYEMMTMEGLIITLIEVEGLWEELQLLLPVYFEWREDLIETARSKGYVETIGGRYRRIQFSESTPWKETSHGERAAANAKVQGSAADIVRRLMLRFGLDTVRLVLQVHDEVLYQYLRKVAEEQRKRDVAILKRVAETGHGYSLSVPLVFDAKIGMSWADK